MTRKIITGSALCLTIVTGLAYLAVNVNSQDKESCTASLVIFQNSERVNVTMDYTYSLKKRTGQVALSGTFSSNEKVMGVIRRDVSYTWTENKDSFQFMSKHVNKSTGYGTAPDEYLSRFLPDFYVYPGKSINFTINNQGSKGYIFSVGKRPVFFCAL